MTELEQLYIERSASELSVAAWLRIAVVILSVGCIAGVIGMIWAVKSSKTAQPYVVRIENGSATADVEGFSYKPQAEDIEHFLSEFCHLYFDRDKYTIGADQGGLADSLLFFAPEIERSLQGEWQDSRLIEKYRANAASPEVIVNVMAVRTVALGSNQWKAWIDMTEDVTTNGNMVPQKDTVQVIFSRLTWVPNNFDMRRVNPLGFVIEELPQVQPE